ncbi:MAG: protein translocase subunit SecF [Alphaproteobacteria bacterium]|nr:protein translocase subunit SecF [Alphaproteobacteria bacterium]
MFKGFRVLQSVPTVDYFRWHITAFIVSGLMMLASVVSLATQGLNYGVDFAGGILVEVRMPDQPDLGAMRTRLEALNIGDVQLQEFGTARDVLIRVERQRGGESAEMAAVARIRESLGTGVDYRRVEVVGPQVGAELVRAGVMAVGLAILGIMAYMALRFGWRAGLSGSVALLHDCLTTVGLFSILQLQFDLNVLAAVMTIAGFSINDTVVIADRVRENERKYKQMDFRALINLSVNETLSRTFMTNGLVLVAVLAILFLGGPVLSDLAIALVWGALIGTYSTVYVAAPLEWYLGRRGGVRPDSATPAAPTA